VVLSVVTSVAASYIALRALDRQLEVSQQTARNYANTMRIFELRHKGGVVSRLELAQVQSQYQQALAAIPALEQRIAAQENLIAVLQGRNPYPIPRGKALAELALPAIPADLPASLLTRRPDILQAEQDMIAANADIGAAEALYYPQINLTGSLGSASAGAHQLSHRSGHRVGAGGGFCRTPLHCGRDRGPRSQALRPRRRRPWRSTSKPCSTPSARPTTRWSGTIKKRDESTAQDLRVKSLREYGRLSRVRFNSGYAGYLEVLYAENELFAAELAAVQSYADAYTQLVAVYRAMGGGWIDLADTGTAAGRAAPVVDRAAKQPLF
jgi:multidrug efflux system outer membrane protein